MRSGYEGALNVVVMASRGQYGPEAATEEEKGLTPEDMRLDTQLDMEVEKSRNVFIIHSSGSTGLPKPVGKYYDTLSPGGSKRGAD